MKGSMQVQSFIVIYIDDSYFSLLSQEYVLVSEMSCIEKVPDGLFVKGDE